MESCRPWWIEAPRAASLYPPGVQNLSLGCLDVIHRKQGPGTLPRYVGVTGPRSPNFAGAGGVGRDTVLATF